MDKIEELPTGTTIEIWNFSFQLPCELKQLQPVNLQCDISELVFLEIFAGSGNLSKAARDVGYSIHPVDSTTKRQTGVAMHVLDLTKDSDSSVLLDLVCKGNIASGHLAPPCGTASRSREKPMPSELSHIRSVPLRSDEHPLGLQNLGHLDSVRVAAANRLYALTLLVMCILHLRGASTSDRIESLVLFLTGLMKKGRINSSEAATLHGQLNFAQGPYYGCSMKPAMSFLQIVMKTSWKNSYSQDLIVMCTYLITSLVTCPPRVISTTDSKQPALLFTDGAFEVESGIGLGSSGLVFHDPLCGLKEVAEVDVPQSLISHWGRGGEKQLIAFLELWPVLLGLHTYGPGVRGRRLLVFIDNNGVRDALIKGSSPLIDLFTMLSLCSLTVSVHSVSPWFTRIPSASNPADDPSRGEPERMAGLLDAKLRQPIQAPETIVRSLLAKSNFVEFMRDAAHSSSVVQPDENGGGDGCSDLDRAATDNRAHNLVQ